MNRYFQISCHALSASAFIALALTGRLDPISMVVFPAVLLVSLYRTLCGRPPLIGGRAAFMLSCAYIVFFGLDMLALSGSFIPASVHLVLFLELVKFLQEKNDKDYVYIIVLAFLKILAAASLTIDVSFVLTLMLFLVALVSTLMSFDILRSERKFRAQRTASGAGYVGSMSVWATLWIVAVGAALFFAIPRVGTEYFTRAATSPLVMSGFTEKVRLGQIGQVKLGSAPVLRARRIGGESAAVFKWRGIALDNFDGQTWSKTDRKHIRLPVTGKRASSSTDPLETTQYVIQPFDGSGDVARYQILLEPMQDASALFGPYRIRGVSGYARSLFSVDRDGDDSIYMRSIGTRVQYEVISEIPRLTRANASAVSEGVAHVHPKYLQLPEDTDPRIRELAAEITRNASSSLEKAARVEAYLKRNYQYSLTLDWAPGQQPVSTFLFSAKRGHCEYFAASMAILLRAAGVGTRMVNGFLMGEYNAIGDHYLVRQSDAHSWVEVYLPGVGWREFDPTPPDPQRGEMSFTGRVSQYVDAMEMFWNSYVLIYDTEAQMQLFRSAQEGAQAMRAAFREIADEWMERLESGSQGMIAALGRSAKTAWFWIAALFIIAGIALYPKRRAVWTELRIRRVGRGIGTPDHAIIEHMFYRAADLARGKDPRREPAQTWREWMLGLSDGNRRSLLENASAVFERSKYGHASASGEDFALLERTIRELRSSPR